MITQKSKEGGAAKVRYSLCLLTKIVHLELSITPNRLFVAADGEANTLVRIGAFDDTRAVEQLACGAGVLMREEELHGAAAAFSHAAVGSSDTEL